LANHWISKGGINGLERDDLADNEGEREPPLLEWVGDLHLLRRRHAPPTRLAEEPAFLGE
jgi:hypothetical protein